MLKLPRSKKRVIYKASITETSSPSFKDYDFDSSSEDEINKTPKSFWCKISQDLRQNLLVTGCFEQAFNLTPNGKKNDAPFYKFKNSLVHPEIPKIIGNLKQKCKMNSSSYQDLSDTSVKKNDVFINMISRTLVAERLRLKNLKLDWWEDDEHVEEERKKVLEIMKKSNNFEQSLTKDTIDDPSTPKKLKRLQKQEKIFKQVRKSKKKLHKIENDVSPKRIEINLKLPMISERLYPSYLSKKIKPKAKFAEIKEYVSPYIKYDV